MGGIWDSTQLYLAATSRLVPQSLPVLSRTPCGAQTKIELPSTKPVPLPSELSPWHRIIIIAKLGHTLSLQKGL